MKEKIHYVIEAALAIAVIVLFVLFFSGNRNTSNERVVVSEDGTAMETMPIAYVDIDSLMVQYTYSIELNERLTKKLEDSRANLTIEWRKFEAEAGDFQRKAETNSFLNQERMQTAYQLLQKKQEDLQQLEVKYSQELEAETISSNEKLRNTIFAQMNEFNKDKGYRFIFGKKNDYILFTDEAYSITVEFIEYLNNQYAKSPILKPNE